MILLEADTIQALPMTTRIISSALIGICTMMCVVVGWKPIKQLLLRQEAYFEQTLRGSLLLDVKARSATILALVVMAVLGVIGYLLTDSLVGAVILGLAGALMPVLVVRYLRRRRLHKLEDQLVGGITTLSSGVRAGLNLVQGIQMVARDGPNPLAQEFSHLVREYDYGVPLEAAMNNAATRIGSGDYRLLFSALQTHRERGGDLGETLDRINESIREIQRLEKRVQTLTAQGRATARWLGSMPVIVMVIIYFLVDHDGIVALFTEDLGKVLLLVIILLNILGFLWIKKIVSIDI